MDTPPVSFAALAQTTPNPAAGGYPYRIRGTDLDKNFVFATLQVDPTLLDNAVGASGHRARRLKIPAVPGSGTHVLGSVDGVLTWIATEEC